MYEKREKESVSLDIVCSLVTRLVVFSLILLSGNQLCSQTIGLDSPNTSSIPPIIQSPTRMRLGDISPGGSLDASDTPEKNNLQATRPPQDSQSAKGPQPLLLRKSNRLKVIGHFQTGINAISEGNVYWNLAEFAAPDVDFDSDPEWLEAYVKPGISFERNGDLGLSTYGKLSAVISGTLEIDAFDRGNTGRTLFEEGYLGIRSQPNKNEDSWDLSFGPRELKLGTGMLIANGAQNGFERGALKFGPRKAWEFAAIGKLKRKLVTTTLFYLDGNELSSNDTETALSGIDFRIDRQSKNYLGTTFIYVPTSDTPYPKAAPRGTPPLILPGAREALNEPPQGW